MRSKLKSLKYKIKLHFYLLIGNYNKAFKFLLKLLRMDLLPFEKHLSYDKLNEKIIDKMLAHKKFTPQKIDIRGYETRILFLNTELYDTGGHTELLLRYVDVFSKDYLIYVYNTSTFKQEERALKKSILLKRKAHNYYLSKCEGFVDKLKECYEYILEHKISTVNVNIHPDDLVGASVLYLLKKHTNINIIFFNHASHYFCLGTIYANKIISGIKDGLAISPYLRGYDNLISLPFLMGGEKLSLKEELNIPENAIISLTGCASSKLKEEYFSLIKRLLQKEERLYHIWVGGASDMNLGFKDERFIRVDFSANFNDYIDLCDFYIDSFPQGSALTLVDCIRRSKPVIIKINEEEKFRSFEEYLYEDYELACKSSEAMYNCALRLINDKDFYKAMQERVLRHYEKTYSINTVKPLYEDLIV